MATAPTVPIPHSRAEVIVPDVRGTLIFRPEWYRVLDALIKRVNELEARLTAHGG